MALERHLAGESIVRAARPATDTTASFGRQRTRTASRGDIRAVPALLIVAVALQISYPLVSGSPRDAITVVTVILVGAAMLTHAAQTRGRRALATLVLVAVVGGFGVEVLGVHSGFPFGSYRYTDSLGPRWLGVPVVIALAWPMLAWPAALAARRLVRTFPARVLVGAWGFAAWDLFLDPQMVAAGHWRWFDPQPHLPGVGAVPLGNFLGWLGVAVLISIALQGVVERSTDDGAPLAFYVWTWASSVLGLAAFLDLAAAALWGGLAMGTVAVPLLVSWARSR